MHNFLTKDVAVFQDGLCVIFTIIKATAMKCLSLRLPSTMQSYKNNNIHKRNTRKPETSINTKVAKTVLLPGPRTGGGESLN